MAMGGLIIFFSLNLKITKKKTNLNVQNLYEEALNREALEDSWKALQ